MADADLRGIERRAAEGDPEAVTRLQHGRCRAGQCCAHVIESVLPVLSPEAHDVQVWTAEVAVTLSPVMSIMPVVREDTSSVMADLSLRVMALDQVTLNAAMQWLLKVFPRVFDHSTGLTEMPMALGRVLYGDKALKPLPKVPPITTCTEPQPGDRGYEAPETTMTCPRCEGSGGDVVECDQCEGNGWVMR